MSGIHNFIISNEALELTDLALALESISKNNTEDASIYILLTDTGTTFSKVAKFITKQPYNHASIAFDNSLTTLYTYAITNANGLKGGLMVEDNNNLKGSRYSLYALPVNNEVFNQVKTKVESMVNNVPGTGYNHLGLINAIFRREIFDSETDSRWFCSQFIVEVLKASGVELFKNKPSSFVKPYDFVKSKLLRFIKRGVIK